MGRQGNKEIVRRGVRENKSSKKRGVMQEDKVIGEGLPRRTILKGTGFIA